MQKAIRNTTGKPVKPESIDKRLEKRHTDSLGTETADMRKLDRQYEPNKLAQAERESDDHYPSED